MLHFRFSASMTMGAVPRRLALLLVGALAMLCSTTEAARMTDTSGPVSTLILARHHRLVAHKDSVSRRSVSALHQGAAANPPVVKFYNEWVFIATVRGGNRGDGGGRV